MKRRDANGLTANQRRRIKRRKRDEDKRLDDMQPGLAMRYRRLAREQEKFDAGTKSVEHYEQRDGEEQFDDLKDAVEEFGEPQPYRDVFGGLMQPHTVQVASRQLQLYVVLAVVVVGSVIAWSLS